ncbi:MAG: ABC transporter substrate-binding protein [Bacteroidota bacterium]|nr:ABC transporter substrate-binding protein [Candidatus Kapabacteria bacterium]MDW8219028.1 ABC transporter substrate-binding protein [Bacteroidota bacterium]
MRTFAAYILHTCLAIILSSSSVLLCQQKKAKQQKQKPQPLPSKTLPAQGSISNAIIINNTLETIKVGMNLVESDPLDLPQWRAAQLAIEEINAAGGVLGKRLELVTAISPNRQYDRVYPNVKRLLDSGITCLIVPDGSELTLKIAKLTIVRDALMIATSSTSPEISNLQDNDLVWRTSPSDVFQGRVVADILDSMGMSAAAIIYVDNNYGAGLSTYFQEAFQKKGGTITAVVHYPSLPSYKDYDFKEHLETLYRDKPKAVYIISDIEDGIKIAMQSQIYGFFTKDYKPQLIGCDANYGNDFLFAVNPSVIEGMLSLSYVRPHNYSNHEKFIARLKQFLRDKQDSSTYAFNVLDGLVDAETIDTYASTAYDAVYTVALAIAKSQSLAAPDIAKNIRLVTNAAPQAEIINPNEFGKALTALQKGKRINYNGASGPIEFDDKGDVTGGSYTLWRVHQGRYTVVRTISFP